MTKEEIKAKLYYEGFANYMFEDSFEHLVEVVYDISNSGADAGYASLAPSGDQNGGQWQKCLKCDGQGIVSKPPWVAGDVTEWTSAQTSYPCDLCGGAKVIKQ